MRKGKYQSKGTKIVVLMLAMMLVFGCAMGGTLAYLLDVSNEVTNTFTIGNVEITLAETTGTDYKITPGATVDKDPTITVKHPSEKCYVYVLVDNTVALNGTVVATPNISTTDWTSIATNGTKTLYRYKEVVNASSADVEIPVFTKVTYSDTILKDNIAALTGTKIIMKAFAHQSDSVEQTVADAAAKTQLGLN